MEQNNNKRYFATLGGIRVEISKDRAEQIKRLQRLIADQRKQQSDKQKVTENKTTSETSSN